MTNNINLPIFKDIYVLKTIVLSIYINKCVCCRLPASFCGNLFYYIYVILYFAVSTFQMFVNCDPK